MNAIPIRLQRERSTRSIFNRDNHDDGEVFVAVGIDFGTTYCGVSWALSEHPDTINEISEWPAQDPFNSGEEQVPTVLDLDSERWGYQVTPKDKPIKWFKLLLLKETDIQREEIRVSPQLQDARDQLARKKLTATKVVAKYLSKLWKHTMDQLSARLGPENLDDLPIRVAITVPAIWPPYAEKAMRDAAKIAKITVDRDMGTTTLDLVQEPEAAALSIFMDRRVLIETQIGSSFVVCDAGGGTVDVISYTVESTTPFRLVECAKGDGRLSGAFRVDEAFEAYLTWEIKLKLDSLDTAEHNDFVTREWEIGAKRSFTGSPETPEYFLTPPMKAVKKRDRWRGKGRFGISKETMAGFFDRSLTGILSLVGDQVKRVRSNLGQDPTSILLVGGLGGSQYIYNRLTAQYGPIIRRPMSKPWSAVARGAVIRLMQDRMTDPEHISELTPEQVSAISRIPEVITRKSRYSYGIVSNHSVAGLRDFDPSIDLTHTNPKGVEVTPRMDWYLKKGEDVSKRNPVLWDYVQYAQRAAPSRCKFTIYYCESDNPPKRKETDRVLELCSITGEWDIPFEEWQPVGNNFKRDGWRAFEDLALAMRFPGTRPVWALRVGANQSEHPVDVEYMG